MKDPKRPTGRDKDRESVEFSLGPASPERTGMIAAPPPKRPEKKDED